MGLAIMTHHVFMHVTRWMLGMLLAIAGASRADGPTGVPVHDGFEEASCPDAPLPARSFDAPSSGSTVVVEDFEAYEVGTLPSRWGHFSRRTRRFQDASPGMEANAQFVVMEEEGDKFLRAYTKGKARRLSLSADELDWSLSAYPEIRWCWRAHRLPEGAREDRVNDSGGALYVTFPKNDWLGRPLSVKYVYSTSLPTGTTVSTGNVKIIVASSGLDGTGHWVQVARNVIEDYRLVFGGSPPDEPFTVTVWSDSDNTKSTGEVDFDDLVLARR